MSNETKSWPRFESPFFQSNCDGYWSKTLREMEMIQLSSTIRRKALWYQKMQNPEIIGKWKAEAKNQGLTDRQISYVFQELSYYASLRDPELGIEVSDVDGVWHSDILIENGLKHSFSEEVSELENIPEWKKDWHPGSNNQVWNLVHPSLYPIVYGKTRVLELLDPKQPLACVGAGQIIPFPGVDLYPNPVSIYCHDEYTFSEKFSWLPTDFAISENGTVKIDSYVNNLHPGHHAELYRALEQIFAKFVPLFEKILNDETTQCHGNCPRIADNLNWYEDATYQGVKVYSYDQFRGHEFREWWANRKLVVPDAPEVFIEPEKAEKRVTLLGSTVQAIVKIVNIMLTPENPKYPGGTWHVEGMKNENIVATGIYYYDVKNITDSELGFRHRLYARFGHEDAIAVKTIYGLSEEGPENQYLGSVQTKENRCLAFPNIYQHRVDPFELADSTKPGHRKILVFFLVDPGKPVLSTASVPPQQMDWYVEELVKFPPFDALPPEIIEKIVSFLDWPFTTKEVEALRLELMNERKYFVSEINQKYYERPFSLCEH